MQAQVYDCFTFFDELDVLELRLSELAPHVHRFVLVEGTRTFSGRSKPLHFLDNRNQFRRYLHKIEHVVLEDGDFPQGEVSAWDREHFSRSAIVRGLKDSRPDDFVLVSDVDEIPMPDQLLNVLARPNAGREINVFESCCYVYFFNLRANRAPSLVQAPRLIQRRYLRDPQTLRGFKPRISRRLRAAAVEAGVQYLRTWRKFGHPLRVRINPRSAWHFTYNGTPEQIKAKILAYSHTEKALPSIVNTNAIAEAVANRTYVFDTAETFEKVPLDSSLPKTLQSDTARWIDCLA